MLRKFLSITLTVLMIEMAMLPAAVPASAAPGKLVPPGNFLNPDGSLRLDGSFSGALDLADWDVNLDPQRGPVFAPAAAVTPGWNALGPGLNDYVKAIAISGSDVYVGGQFTDAGGYVYADRIAKWNGSAWFPLGEGLNGTVFAIAISGSNVYVGGNFTNVGGNANASHIARWDGSNWSALGSGLNGRVWSIAISGSNVYVGGEFTDAGGNASASYIAKWNGSAWLPLGSGLNYTAYAIAINGSDVYVGGVFDDAGGIANADYIAKWNGSNWSALGSGLNNTVSAIAISGSNVYAGGWFTDAGGYANADRIARWNGSYWSALGTGLNNWVNAIAISGSNVYVGGRFTDAGGNSHADNLARWDGSNWYSLGGGLSERVSAISISGSNVYAGGDFEDAGGNDYACYIAFFHLLTGIFTSQAAKDGWILESSETSGKGGTMNSTATTFRLGDDAQDRQYRSILSFDTTIVPTNAILTKVTLKIRKQGLVGTNPFSDHGNIAVDIRHGAFGTKGALQLGDFQAAASKNAAGVIRDKPSGGWYSVSFGSSVFSYILLGGVTQFRLRFQTDDDNDNVADYLKFYSGNVGTYSYRPQLIIEFYLP